MGFKNTVDYSLYLVTGRELLRAGADYEAVIEEALKGGVTIVQVREKHSDTRDFLEFAKKTKDICQKYNVPVLINDRIDIALAMGADGVHVGQSDMPLATARSLLPKDSIIGVSCNTPEEASLATKSDIKTVLGVRGIGEILERLAGSNVKAVGIAGINSKNILRTLHGTVSPSERGLDGVAVVSAIMASANPYDAASSLRKAIRSFVSAPPPLFSSPSLARLTPKDIISAAASLLAKVREAGPLVHQITNNVVMTQSANVTLALGASPIMATAVQEMEDLSKISGALLINFGTIADKAGMLEAGRWANATRKPIVFDPVAVGATQFRFNAAQELLDTWQASVIKGNPAEIGALAKSAEVQSKGVDSVGSGFADPSTVLTKLARKERCIIAMTGETDWISDGKVTVSSSNGHKLLADITGSGCIVGTSVATFCAAANLLGKERNGVSDRSLVNGDMFIGAVAGILAITVASELAHARDDVKGTGTFLPALIDELYHLTPEKIISRAKVEVHA